MSTTHMEWETGEEIEGWVTARGRSDPRVGQFDGLPGVDRVAAVRRGLAHAVDNWQQRGEMPPQILVRDALLALEAGHRLDEAGRTLLLRGALFYGKGMRTALHHLNAPDRAASVMRDMLLHPTRPLAPAQIVDLARQDDGSTRWMVALRGLLREEMAQPLEPRRTLAHATLEYLRENGSAQSKPVPWVSLSSQNRPVRTKAAPRQHRILLAGPARQSIANLFGLLALALLVLSLIFLWLDWQQSFTPLGETVSIPSGVYRISDPAQPDTDRRVEVGSFSIDRTEVTNQAYRLCYEAGACTWPARTTSITRPDYFLNPALENFPVINVNHTQAMFFCRWAGKRLPLEEEWEVAASAALALERNYRYPWGDTFDNTLANWAFTSVGDTTLVGTYSPNGDSPSGVADMAGNVAEWTATPADPTEQPPVDFVVKGGSFLDGADGLAASQRAILSGNESHPWLGFRCAVTNATDEQP